MISVLIVDDHALVRTGIRRLLDEADGINVVGEAGTGEEALRFVRESSPDVVLLDVKMPGIGGLEATRRMVRTNPDVKIIAVTAFQEEPFPSRLLQAGASGYLTKEAGFEEMIQAIKKVFKGQRYLTATIAEQLAFKNIGEGADSDSPLDQLSERELQVMLMITTGLKVQEISDKLCLSSKTVNSYRYRLFEKLKVKNDVELTLLAIRHGLLDRELYARTEESAA